MNWYICFRKFSIFVFSGSHDSFPLNPKTFWAEIFKFFSRDWLSPRNVFVFCSKTQRLVGARATRAGVLQLKLIISGWSCHFDQHFFGSHQFRGFLPGATYTFSLDRSLGKITASRFSQLPGADFHAIPLPRCRQEPDSDTFLLPAARSQRRPFGVRRLSF